ncbi:MAG: DUF1572 family protein [Flavipsychrobacter sp.]|nr:DUF1572 family protein [Flavipsychrobacter sp.]
MENFLFELYERDLLKFKEEISSFKNEDHIWEVKPGVTNSAGNLALHLLGNLNHFIGAQVANTGYIRQRDLEFAPESRVSQEMLIAEIEKAITVVTLALKGLSQEELNKLYPLEMFGKHSTQYYLIFFHSHLTYHLGQINYLRRILEG